MNSWFSSSWSCNKWTVHLLWCRVLIFPHVDLLWKELHFLWFCDDLTSTDLVIIKLKVWLSSKRTCELILAKLEGVHCIKLSSDLKPCNFSSEICLSFLYVSDKYLFFFSLYFYIAFACLYRLNSMLMLRYSTQWVTTGIYSQNCLYYFCLYLYLGCFVICIRPKRYLVCPTLYQLMAFVTDFNRNK